MDKLSTYKGVWGRTRKEIEDKIEDETLDKCLEYIKEKGAHILNLRFSDNGSEYYHRLDQDIHQKFIDEDVLPSGLLPSSAMEGFFEELYTGEYADAVAWPPFKVEKI